MTHVSKYIFAFLWSASLLVQSQVKEFSIRPVTGRVLSLPSEKEFFSVFSNAQKEHHSRLGHEHGLYVEFGITRKFSIGTGFMKSWTSYEGEQLVDPFHTTYSEFSKSFIIPFYGKYVVGSLGDFNLYLSSGVDYRILRKSQLDIFRKGGTSIAFTEYNVGSMRNEDQIQGRVGIGTSWNHLFLEVVYSHAFDIHNVPERRYSDSTLSGDFLFIDSDLLLNFISLRVGYSISI